MPRQEGDPRMMMVSLCLVKLSEPLLVLRVNAVERCGIGQMVLLTDLWRSGLGVPWCGMVRSLVSMPVLMP